MLSLALLKMQFTATYDLPEQVATTLRHHWKALARINLEDLAIIGYTMGILSSYQIRQMLHHGSRWDTEQFLHGISAIFTMIRLIFSRMEMSLRN